MTSSFGREDRTQFLLNSGMQVDLSDSSDDLVPFNVELAWLVTPLS